MAKRLSVDNRQIFAVEAGHLVRTVTNRDGSTYAHRCSFASYEAVAYFIQEHAADGITNEMLWSGLPAVPCTQASVALAFMKERGCVRVSYRRSFPASICFFEDAMTEYHALDYGGRDGAETAEV
jgi:hypothetical protein